MSGSSGYVKFMIDQTKRITIDPRALSWTCLGLFFHLSFLMLYPQCAQAEKITMISDDMYIKEYEADDFTVLLSPKYIETHLLSLLAKKELWLRSKNTFPAASMRMNVSCHQGEKTVGISFNVASLGKKKVADNPAIRNSHKCIVKYRIDEGPVIIDYWPYAVSSDWIKYMGFVQPEVAVGNYKNYVESSESFLNLIRHGQIMQMTILLSDREFFQCTFDISKFDSGLIMLSNKCS